jgi:uncharacterized membrane protein (UPF0127 family)
MFLAPLLRQPDLVWALEEVTSHRTIVSRVHAAVDSASRKRGLLGRTGLDDTALVIAPCNAVHTFFMRFPIDVLFVDRHGRVLRVAREVPPWRLAAAWRAFAVIELAAAAAGDITVGDQVGLRAMQAAAPQRD